LSEVGDEHLIPRGRLLVGIHDADKVVTGVRNVGDAGLDMKVAFVVYPRKEQTIAVGAKNWEHCGARSRGDRATTASGPESRDHETRENGEGA
jgi:hypothetical protein